MGTLIPLAIIVILMVSVILIVAGCKLISAANELSRGAGTQSKILQTLQNIQKELTTLKKEGGGVPPEKLMEVPAPVKQNVPEKQPAGDGENVRTASVASDSASARTGSAASGPEPKTAPRQIRETVSRGPENRTYEIPKSEFEKRTEEALEKLKNWICVGEEYRNREVSAEYAVATTWLIRIGILILICGVGFFVKYSIDNNLVSPEVRVFGMLFTACGMVVGGLHFAEKRYHSVALGIIGLGFVTGYLGIFSACRMYDLIGWQWAYGAMIFLTVCAMALSVRRNYLFPALAGTLGGYLTPILLSRGGGDIRILFFYLTIISIGIVFCACFRNWKALNIVAFLFNSILYGLASFHGIHADNYLVCILFFAVNYILFASLPTIGMLFRRAKITLIEILLHCGALAVFLCLALPRTFQYGAEYNVAAWLVFGTACFALIQLPVAYLTKNEDRIWNLLQLTFACVGFALFVPLMFSGIWITLIWAALVVGMMALGTKIPNRFLCISALLFYLILALKVFLCDIVEEDFFTGLSYLSGLEHRLLTGGVFLVAVFLGGIFLRTASKRNSPDSKYDLNGEFTGFECAKFFLVTAVSLFFFYSSFELSQALREYLSGFNRGGLSVWWGLWAVGLLFFGIIRTNKTLRKLSLVLFGFCALKIFFYDLANLSSLYKVTAFLLLGILMLAGAVLYTRFRDKFSSKKPS